MTALPLRVFLSAFILTAISGFTFSIGQEGDEKISAAELPIIEASATADLRAKEGRKVIVHGVTADSGKSQSGTNFVKFKGADFYLIAFKSDLEPFTNGEPTDLFDGKRIAVTGVISVYRDQPQIKLTSPDQVRVLKPDELFPPEKPEASADAAEEDPERLIAAVEEPEEIEPEKPKEKPPVDWRKFFK